MNHIDEIAEHIHATFEARTATRDQMLAQARTLTRHCANAIRAAHRDDRNEAEKQLKEARMLVSSFQALAKDYPDLYYAGYTQDALKEFAEASIVFSLLAGPILPAPEDLGIDHAAYLQGLAEAVGELRRRSLDLMLNERFDEAQRLLVHMDDIYDVLVSMDYPDAITGGLRRLTDIARSIIERTRGDLTLSLRQQHLEKAMRLLESRLDPFNPGADD